jgi:5-methyltetrahydrofolate--homocysteine methyltransferase
MGWSGTALFDVHRRVMEKMRGILREQGYYPDARGVSYMSDSCKTRLDEIRRDASELGFTESLVIEKPDGGFAVFPWTGTRALTALAVKLNALGISAQLQPGFMPVYLSVQFDGGAAYLDLNTAMTGEDEVDALRWLIGLTPPDSGVMPDSPDPAVLLRALDFVGERPVIINSVPEKDGYDELIAAAAQRGAGVVVMPLSGVLLPALAAERAEVAASVAAKLSRAGVPAERICVDVLTESAATNPDAVSTALATIREVKARIPGANTVMGLSNVSSGLPGRAWINAAYYHMAAAHGLDAAILDPMNAEMARAIRVNAALTDGDDGMMDYIEYFREMQE